MSEQQYRVIADRDKGDDPQWTDIVDGDRVLYISGSRLEMARVDRIERPVPTTDEPVHDAAPEEVAASLLPPCGFDTEAYAQAHNDGYDTAVAQELQDHPAAFVAALRAAAHRIEQEQPSPHTPTREQIAEATYSVVRPVARFDNLGPGGQALYLDIADAVLALIQNGADHWARS